jgi:FlaA1/EpsC-like NDP-sugar epimerase
MNITDRKYKVKQFKDKRIFITGSCGTIGAEIVKELLKNPEYSPKEIIGIDNNEGLIFFQDQEYIRDERARFFVADIRDPDVLLSLMQDVDIVIHTAALKHVILCERSPEQAVQTNINGVENVIAAAKSNNVEIVVFTSSDKAVNPTNVMGTSKLMGERLMTAANSNSRGGGPIFLSTRFGNVLGSSGSVIPIFRQQITAGGPVTLTDTKMTRFVMTIKDAVDLVLLSIVNARGGEVFVTKMPVINIKDLAIAMIEEIAADKIEIEEIGCKPGEKLYEELMSDEETRRAVELPKFFSVLPAFRNLYTDIDYDYPNVVEEEVTDPYISEKQEILSVSEIKQLLISSKLI